MDQSEYLQSRVDTQINWMEEKSKYNQQQYKLLKATELIAAAAIPFLAGFHRENDLFPIITGILGVLIVAMNGLQQLYKYHENWLNYRGTIEELTREKFLFESATEPYNDPEAFHRFVQNIEAVLTNENRKWKANWMQKPEQKKT